MSNLIDRQQAIDALKEAFNPSITNFVKAKMAIDNLPSAHYFRVTAEHGTPVKVEYASDADVVEVVRCKDCKHRDNYGCCKHWKGLAMGDIPIATDDNDFCSRAERRTE